MVSTNRSRVKTRGTTCPIGGEIAWQENRSKQRIAADEVAVDVGHFGLAQMRIAPWGEGGISVATVAIRLRVDNITAQPHQ